MLGHCKEETTAGYQREGMRIRTEIVRARKAFRERDANGVANDRERRSTKSTGQEWWAVTARNNRVHSVP
jgi:hypothetical protein